MPLCRSCGAESASGNKFCGSCGAVLPAPAPAPRSSRPTPEASAWTPGSQAQKPQRERAGINAGVVAAGAVGVLLILGGIAWFMWPAGSSSGPDPKLLVSRLTSELPAYIKLTNFQVITVDRGNEATPVVRTKFQARFVARADTFVETGKEGDIVLLAPRLSTGAIQPVTGSALSRLNAGEWQTEFSLEDNAIARFGTPRELFCGTLDQDPRPCIELERRAEASDSVVIEREFSLPLAGVQPGERAACDGLNIARRQPRGEQDDVPLFARFNERVGFGHEPSLESCSDDRGCFVAAIDGGHLETGQLDVRRQLGRQAGDK